MSQVKYYDTGSSQWVAAIVGAQGAQGTAGFVGSNGANGAQGSQGVQGLQGIQGPTGLQGIQGPFNPTAAKTVATFTATAGQTTFTTSYTVGYIDVYLNGVRLSGADYTATNGTSVVIATALNAGDTVDVVQYTMGQGIQGIQGISGAGTLQMWRYTASGGETSLSGTDGFSTTLTYTVGAEQVFVNGVLLERGVDYTATTGTSITGLTALVAGDVATVISYSSFSFANAIPVSTVTAKGDLIAATGASTVTKLPVGSDGYGLVANSASATGVAWTPLYVGTTAIPLNRASASQTLTGVSIDGNAATVTNGLTTSNYSSYALPISGGTMTGVVIGQAQPATGYTIANANDTGNFSVRATSSASGSPASMSFHRPGIYAVNMGIDTDNYFKIGGWSAGILMSISTTGATTIAGALTQNSDISLKENLVPLTNALDKVKRLKGYNYNRIGSEELEMGVVAQEVQEVLPEVVSKSSEGILSVAYSNMVAVLIEAVKEQSAEIDVLKEQVKEQSAEIDALKKAGE
jgi:hypothetical protein